MVRETGVESFGLEVSVSCAAARSMLELPAAATFTTPLPSAYLAARPTASTMAPWSRSSLQLNIHGST